MNKLVYLDNAATTRVHPSVVEAMTPFLTEGYGNPSSLHAAGRAARKAVDDARAAVARTLGAHPMEVVFTSGGTEADNLALFGAARARRAEGKGGHVVVSAVEHSAVLNAAEALEEEGFAVTRVGVDAAGRVDPGDVGRALRPDTVLVSVMLVNNETGVVQPVAEIARLARASGVLMHTDAVQAFGKIPVDVRDLGVDLLSVSAHKIHGPKGVGALYVRKGTPLRPVQVGGHQEWDRRGGTENVAGIVGFGVAVERAMRELPARCARMEGLRERLERGIIERIERVKVNGGGGKGTGDTSRGTGDEGRGTRERGTATSPVPRPPSPASLLSPVPLHERAPHLLNVSFEGAEGESLLISLDTMGVCVATGSACASGSVEPSHVLTAMGLPLELAQGALRFSVSEETTAEEVDYAVECLVKAVGRLREMSPIYEKVERLK
jgi:cysteine desulfurase